MGYGIVIAAVVGGMLLVGGKVGHGVKVAAVAVNHKVVQPVKCGVEKVGTLGHHQCKKAQAKAKAAK